MSRCDDCTKSTILPKAFDRNDYRELLIALAIEYFDRTCHRELSFAPAIESLGLGSVCGRALGDNLCNLEPLSLTFKLCKNTIRHGNDVKSFTSVLGVRVGVLERRFECCYAQCGGTLLGWGSCTDLSSSWPKFRTISWAFWDFWTMMMNRVCWAAPGFSGCVLGRNANAHHATIGAE